MKVILCVMIFLASSCKIEDTRNQRVVTTSTTNKPSGFFEKSIERINALLHVLDDVSPFCQALLQNTPTRDDYIRSWKPHGELAYCPGDGALESCQKKTNDAFEEGLLCFRNQVFSIGN